MRPGKYHLPPTPLHPSGKVVTYKKSDARHVTEQAKRQRKAGLVHPMCWMHDEDAEPQYLSNIHEGAWPAKGYFGEAVGFEIDPDGTAVAIVNVPDADDAKQFNKFKRVSPCLIHDWIDEQNVKWPGLSIIHIGATPTPVQRYIGQATAAYLSHFSINPALRLQKGEMQCLSYSASIPRSSPMVDDNEMEDMETPVDDMEPDGDDFGGGDEGVKKAVDFLSKHGVLHLGNPKTWEEFQVALEAAVETDMGGGDDGAELGNDDGAMMDEGTEAVSGTPMMMSYKAQVANLQSQVAALSDEKVKARIDNLRTTGRVDDKTHAKLVKDYSTDNLSHEPHKKFNKAGKLKALPILVRIAAYEDLPTRMQSKANLSNTSSVANLVRDDVDAGEKELEAILRKNRNIPAAK